MGAPRPLNTVKQTGFARENFWTNKEGERVHKYCTEHEAREPSTWLDFLVYQNFATTADLSHPSGTTVSHPKGMTLSHPNGMTLSHPNGTTLLLHRTRHGATVS